MEASLTVQETWLTSSTQYSASPVRLLSLLLFPLNFSFPSQISDKCSFLRMQASP
jgi:hypothetical protein